MDQHVLIAGNPVVPQVVLFDVYSLDSFAACCAARKALPHAEFEGHGKHGICALVLPFKTKGKTMESHEQINIFRDDIIKF